MPFEYRKDAGPTEREFFETDPDGTIVVGFDDARFSGGASTPEPAKSEVKCTFFPKNAAQDMLRKLIIANSTMVRIEEAVRVGLSDEGLADRMAEIRCTQFKILRNAVVPGNAKADKTCALYEDRPGFKWVPKPPDQPRGEDGRFE